MKNSSSILQLYATTIVIVVTFHFASWQIVWENRKRGAIGNWYASVDGTDFPILEPKPFEKKWYSHKFKGPGVRYEVATAVGTGWIVWVNGPFPCGAWPDIKIAKDDITKELEPQEMLVADSGYRSNLYFVNPTNVCEDMKITFKQIRARHERVNRRFKMWGALKGKFRHGLDKHYLVFISIANITQIIFESENITP